jgi:hypothetical protein
MKLMVKSAKEMLAVLDETKETLFKDRKCTYPYTEWEHKRAQVKERRLTFSISKRILRAGWVTRRGILKPLKVFVLCSL